MAAPGSGKKLSIEIGEAGKTQYAAGGGPRRCGAVRMCLLRLRMEYGGMAENSETTELESRAEEALDRFGNAVLRLAYAYLHSMEDAQDILQDTLIQLIRTKPVFNDEEHQKAWLLRVAANLSKNRIVYNKRRTTDELKADLAADKREDLAYVWDAVLQLKQNYRAAVHLHYYEGYSTAEIAQILDRKESTVRTDLRRGRMQLRKILEEDYWS